MNTTERKLIFFDCDETLWTSEGKDYISSVDSTLEKDGKLTIFRVTDKKRFILRPDVKDTFTILLNSLVHVHLGIISDNKPGPVLQALTLFGLYSFLHPQAINVRLWTGPCPKEIMIEEILAQAVFKDIKRSEVYLVDDKDYSGAMSNQGMNFIKIDDNDSFLKKVTSQIIK